MQTSKQPFPPEFVYLLHAAPRLRLPDQSASNGGDDEDDELPESEDEDDEQTDDDDAD